MYFAPPSVAIYGRPIEQDACLLFTVTPVAAIKKQMTAVEHIASPPHCSWINSLQTEGNIPS